MAIGFREVYWGGRKHPVRRAGPDKYQETIMVPAANRVPGLVVGGLPQAS